MFVAFRNRRDLALEKLGNKTETFIHVVTHFPRHLGPSPNALLCNPCLRNILYPMCREAQTS